MSDSFVVRMQSQFSGGISNGSILRTEQTSIVLNTVPVPSSLVRLGKHVFKIENVWFL